VQLGFFNNKMSMVSGVSVQVSGLTELNRQIGSFSDT